jgi:probable F420-dependent oxidoreductase
VRWTIALPNDRVDAVDEFLVADAVAALSRGFEDAGFDACFVTDHPFADDRWLAAGGHHAMDPLVLLGVAAAATKRLLLHTNILVLPYRNPFLVAKSVLTLDVASQGRVIVGVGAGYLKSEFGALGVDFEERNDLVDEALDAMKVAWTTEAVVYEGRHFKARGNTMLPRPFATPHPPIWMGGNSTRAIRRAVEHCQGWTPFLTHPAARTRTTQIATLDELARRIDDARKYAAATGRTTPLEICLGLMQPSPGEDGFDPGAARAQVRALADAGVTWVGVRPAAADRASYLAMARRFADEVVDPLR